MLDNIVVAGAPTSNEVTIYTEGFAVVKETRSLHLEAGVQSVAVTDIPAEIVPQSVGVRSIKEEGSIEVLEQNYQFDLATPRAILHRSIGERVRIIRSADHVEGTLMSISGDNGIVVQTDDSRLLLNPKGAVEVLTLPPDLVTKPTLLWDVHSKHSGPNEIELSYQAMKVSWQADYVLTIDGSGRADLNGWVTVRNESEATYRNARLKLMAGNVHLTEQMRVAIASAGAHRRVADDHDTPEYMVAEEPFFEYHLYTLPRPATLRAHETKQLSLAEGYGIPVKKKLVVDSTRGHRYYPSDNEYGTGKLKPLAYIEFVNSAESNLGIPLPRGTVRMFQRDRSGSVQFLGEDRIPHVPKDARIGLRAGQSFDISASRKRVEYKRVLRHSHETFEIEIRNRKDTPETVHIVERSWGQWKLLRQSHTSEKLDANTFQFEVPLKAGEVAKVVYSIETKW